MQEAKDILVKIIEDMNTELDKLGLYTYDYDMVIDSNKSFDSLEELRQAAKSSEAKISFNVHSYISSSLWEAFDDISTSFFGIEKIPLAEIFKLTKEDEENL